MERGPLTARTFAQRAFLSGLIAIMIAASAGHLLLLLRSSLPTASRSVAAVAPFSPFLVYQELRGDQTLLWEVQAPTLDQPRLIATLGHRRDYGGRFALSPDGRGVAYTLLPAAATDQGPDAELWVVARDGKGQRLATGVDLRAPPVWSADGRWVLYRRSLSQEITTSAELWQVARDDPTNQRLLLREGRFLGLYPFAWSPGGALVYYASVSAAGTDLWAIDTTTSATKLLAHLSDGVARHFSLAPDGGKVLFQAPLKPRAPTDYRIAQVDLVSQEIATILTSASDHLNPIWSADGVGVTYSDAAPGQRGISTIRRPGAPAPSSAPVAASPPEGFDVPLAWSADGRYLALRFLLGQEARSVTGERLAVWDNDTGARVVVEGQGPLSFIGWAAAP